MKRVLFVSRDYNARNDGGSAVAKRNLAFLKALGLQVAELTIGVPSLAVRLKNVLLRESYGDRRSLRKQLKYHSHNPMTSSSSTGLTMAFICESLRATASRPFAFSTTWKWIITSRNIKPPISLKTS